MKSKKTKPLHFCPRCGAKLGTRKMHGTERLVCRECHFIFYQNSAPTASAIIANAKGEVLLVKRAIQPKKGYWDLPGGFLENGEDPVTGVCREIKEELGVVLHIKRIVGIYVDRYFYQYWAHTFNVDYECTIKSGKLKPMDDVAELKWFPKKSIPWPWLAFSHLEIGLRDWIRQTK